MQQIPSAVRDAFQHQPSASPCRGRGWGGRTSVRIPLAAREKSPYVLDNALCDATREHDAVQWPPTAGQSKRAPVSAPRCMYDKPTLLSAHCCIARLRQQRREQRAVARERRQRDGLPRRARRHLHCACFAFALHLCTLLVSFLRGGGERGEGTYLHPCAAVLQPVYTWPRDEAETYVRAAVAALCVGGLDAQLVRVGPGGSAGSALVVREPGEEPCVRAVLVIDLERDEQASAERDGGEHRGAAEHGDTNSDTLCFRRSGCTFILAE